MITMGFDSKHKDWVLVLSYLEYEIRRSSQLITLLKLVVVSNSDGYYLGHLVFRANTCECAVLIWSRDDD